MFRPIDISVLTYNWKREEKEEKMEGGGKVRREKRKWEGDGRVEEGNGEKPPKPRF